MKTLTKVQAQAIVTANDTSSAYKKGMITRAAKVLAAHKETAAQAPSKADAAQTKLDAQAAQEEGIAKWLEANPAKADDVKKSLEASTKQVNMIVAKKADFYTCKGYSQVTDNGGKANGYFRSLTIAALIQAGFLQLKGQLVVPTQGKGNIVALKYLTSPTGTLTSTMVSHWSKLGAFNKDKDSLSVVGINKASDSMNTTKGSELRADPKIIKGLLEGMTKSGKQVIEGRTVQFFGISVK